MAKEEGGDRHLIIAYDLLVEWRTMFTRLGILMGRVQEKRTFYYLILNNKH